MSRAISGETQKEAALSGCRVCACAGSSDACAEKVRHQSTNARRKMLSVAKVTFMSHLELHMGGHHLPAWTERVGRWAVVLPVERLPIQETPNPLKSFRNF